MTREVEPASPAAVEYDGSSLWFVPAALVAQPVKLVFVDWKMDHEEMDLFREQAIKRSFTKV